jgi:O-antigen/teichoic acid export membrane protein
MMTVVIGLVGCLANAGVTNAIIYHQDATPEELSSLYWLNFLVGIALFILILFARPLAVAFFDEPRLSIYLPFVATSFLVLPAGQQFRVLLRKELEFEILTRINVFATSIACAMAIGIAFFGFGTWSLIFRPIVISFVASGCLFYVGFRRDWLPSFHFLAGNVRKYLGFGSFQIGERVFGNILRNVDYLVIGRFIGPEALGFYSLAYDLITLPLSKINPVIGGVAFPTFAKMQSDDSWLKSAYLTMLRYISTFTFPIMAGMFMIAPYFIPAIYGPQWSPAIPVLQILCVVGALKSLGNPVGSLLLAKGRADIGFYFTVFATVITLVGCIIGVNWGIEGVACSIAVSTVLVLWPVDIYIRWLLVRMTPQEYFRSFRFPGIAAVLMMILLWLNGPIWDKMTNLWNLIFQIFAGAAAYMILHCIFARSFCSDLYNTVINRKK